MPKKIMPEPFSIAVPDEVLDDLHHRLALTRWPDEISESGWQFGSNLHYLKELIAYWQNKYDWRAQERLLNSFAHYRVQLDDIVLHYIHQPGEGPDPFPLLICHGWMDRFMSLSKSSDPSPNRLIMGVIRAMRLL